MGAKKAANLFRIYCFMCRCGAAGYSVFMLSVKPKLEQAFNQLCSDVVLHIRVIITVHVGEVADISSVSVKDGLYRYHGYSGYVLDRLPVRSWKIPLSSIMGKGGSIFCCRPLITHRQGQAGLSTVGAAHLLAVDWLGWFCYF